MWNFINTRWRMYYISLGLLFIVLLIPAIFYNAFLALVLLFSFLALFAWMIYNSNIICNSKLDEYLLTLNCRIKNASDTALKSLPFGVVLYDRHSLVEWYNLFVQEMMENKRFIGQNIWEVFRGIEGKEEVERFELGDRIYNIQHNISERLLYILDVTSLREFEQQLSEDKTVLGFIHLDNREEVEQGLTDQAEDEIQNNIYSTILKWGTEHNIVVKRLDSDRLLVVMLTKTLNKLIKLKFDILDTVREMNKKSKVPITLSIGISDEGENIVDTLRHAQSVLELALARGGDQVALRRAGKVSFLGGKSNALEKRTRVKARMVSHAIANLVRDSERVIIMGHTNPDMDALGSAIGMAKFALLNDCTPYIVLDRSNSSIERLVDAIDQHELLFKYLVTPEVAFDLLDQEDSLLILVDTHRPSLAMDARLLNKADKIVVIDHHRRGEDFVHNAVLVYLEPYASSTCELVSELLQYQEGALEMDTLEATALLAGIVVDTQNFSYRSGSRTFEAASFLRKHGADLAMVQMLLKEDLQQYLDRSKLIKNTIMIHDKIAIATGEEEEYYDQLLIAQAADTLLNMQGIISSFVIAMRSDGRVSVSARSQGELNVQLIMEQLGGGGHLTNAACQFQSRSIPEVKELLLNIINEHMESRENLDEGDTT